MAEIKSMLDEVIEAQIENLSSVSPEAKSGAIDDLVQLHKLRIEEIKAKNDAQDKSEQIREAKIDRIVKIGVAAADLLVPLAFYGIWMKQGFQFEKDGSFTSITFKNLLSRFRPTK